MSTLVQIRGNVRINLGEQVPRFWQNYELNAHIGEAYKKYSTEMIEAGQGYFATEVNLPIISGQSLISVTTLTPPFFSFTRLERVTGNGTTIPLRPSERRFRTNSSLSVGSGSTYLPTYRKLGTNIVIEPTPQFSEAASDSTGLLLGYNYVPTFPTSASADNFTFDADFPITYEAIIELYATIKALETRDGMGGVADIQSFRDRLQSQEQAFYDSLDGYEYPDRIEYSGQNYNNPYFY